MSIHRNCFKIAAIALAIAAAAQPAFADETVAAVGNHHFVYYRNHDIYFSPETRTYFWMSDGKWQSGPILPAEDQTYVTSPGVDIQLDTALPYQRHEYVVSHYKTDSPTRETTTTERTVNDDGSTSTTTTTTKRHYVYYGDHDIYFAPDRKVYYWLADGSWQSGPVLPSDQQAFARDGGVPIELDTDRPYTRNEYVIAHYRHQHDRDDDRQ